MDVELFVSEIVQVCAPYKKGYPEKARQAGGLWNGANNSWDFPLKALNRVRTLNLEVYGVYGDERELVDARLHFLKERHRDKEPVVVAGCVIASARGRDTGSLPGLGVVFEEGSGMSGGSRAAWCSVVVEGSKVLVKAPKHALEALSEADSDIEVEILDLKPELSVLDEYLLDLDGDIGHLEDELNRVRALRDQIAGEEETAIEDAVLEEELALEGGTSDEH